MILAELTAAIDADGTEQTFRVADAEFQTQPADTPPNVPFLKRLTGDISLGRHAYSDGRTGGATRLETGEIHIANIDGKLDGWIDYSFDARPVVIRQGDGGAYPGDFTTLVLGTADGIEATEDKIIVRLRDKQYLFESPVCTTLYAGSNSLPGGLEGTASDIKGTKKPRGWGQVFNVTPPCVNTSRNIYEVGTCQSVDVVYEGGNVLTKGVDYADQAAMEAAAPAAGTFRCWGGYFRIPTTPSAEITADVTYSSAANSTCAQIIKALALDAGIAGGEISSGDVTALDTACNYVLGIFLNDDTPYLAALDAIASSIGAWFGFDAAGILRMGQLAAPSGAPDQTFYRHNIKRLERRPPRDAKGRPIWRATVKHARNYTVQAGGLHAAASAERRAFVAEDYRRASAEDASIKTQWKLAGELEVDTLITAAADAASEATRLRDLYKVRRDVFDMTVPAKFAAGLDLMAVVRVVHPRYALAAGRDFRVIGLSLELLKNQTTLTLWG